MRGSKKKQTVQQKFKSGKSLNKRKRSDRTGKLFEDLVALLMRLRGPNGCPWDREQTHQSLRPFLVEEAYEVLDAMDSRDSQKFASELGDLLLQIVFHAELAREAGEFGISDVIQAVHEKMVRRHSHVFGRVKARDAAAVLKNWEEIKAQERANEASGEKMRAESALSGVPRGLPALLEGYQLSRRAANVGFDWENREGVFEKIVEEMHEIRGALRRMRGKSVKHGVEVEDEIGDLFFAIVNLARFVGIEPELAMKRANEKFKKRFQWMEWRARERGSRLADVARAEMEELWNESKVQA